MKTLFLLGLILLIAPFDALASGKCEELRSFEAQFNADTPRKIDDYTELTQIIVNCDTEVVLYNKRVLVPADALSSGAAERKQRQHTQMHCNKNGLASVTKWTAQDVLHDVNYKYMFTLTTTPDDCNKG